MKQVLIMIAMACSFVFNSFGGERSLEEVLAAIRADQPWLVSEVRRASEAEGVPLADKEKIQRLLKLLAEDKAEADACQGRLDAAGIVDAHPAKRFLADDRIPYYNVRMKQVAEPLNRLSAELSRRRQLQEITHEEQKAMLKAAKEPVHAELRRLEIEAWRAYRAIYTDAEWLERVRLNQAGPCPGTALQ